MRDLLASPVLGEAMAELRADFDWIILDTPPLGVNLDAVAVALHAQATLLLVREGLTPRRLVHKAIRALKDVGAPVIGTVLAGCRTPRAGVG